MIFCNYSKLLSQTILSIFTLHPRRDGRGILDFTFIIISLLMFPLLGHMPSLLITHKENGPFPTTRAQYGLVEANDCKCSRDLRLNVSSEARRRSRQIFDHPSNTRLRLLNFRDSTSQHNDRRAIELLRGFYFELLILLKLAMRNTADVRAIP
jgi:hypothetical protein